eukprot:gene6752-4844_t
MAQAQDSVAPFDPVALGLPKDCKLPQPKLIALLEELAVRQRESDNERPPGMMDCSIVPLHHRNERGEALYLVSTTDFFFPSVEDPYVQGQIGAANVLSDLYSMGIVKCDNMLMLLAASTDMDEMERTVTTTEILRGFAERVSLAQTRVTGGQTVMNPWPLIGGVAMSVVAASEMISPSGQLRVGDVLVLTKPLGNQIAVNLQQWVSRPSPLYEKKVKGRLSEEEIHRLYARSCASMRRLNRTAAELMHTFHAHGATDVTGFGILGHATNFGAAQQEPGVDGKVSGENVCLLLEKLPIFGLAVTAARLMDDHYKLFQGLSAETSGGLLVALESESVAEAFIQAIQEREGSPAEAWIVGRVIPREGSDGPYARLESNARILEV